MYTWSNDDAYIWDGETFDNIEECIEDAKSHGAHAGDSIFVGECKNVEIGGIDLDDILYRVEENVYEQIGEVSENWNIYSTSGDYTYRKPIYDKYDEKLRQLVLDYIEEIGETPKFQRIVNVQEIVIGE